MAERTYSKVYAAWYADALGEKDEPEITFGTEDGEMLMRWVDLVGKTPRLECFSDAFPILATMPDLVHALAEEEGTAFTEDEFAAILENCGFRDVTPYERPQDQYMVEVKIAQLEKKLADLRDLLEKDA